MKHGAKYPIIQILLSTIIIGITIVTEAESYKKFTEWPLNWS